MGRLKDHLESVGDYGSEHAERPMESNAPFNPWRMKLAKTLLKSHRQTALININRKSTLCTCLSLPLSVCLSASFCSHTSLSECLPSSSSVLVFVSVASP